MGLKVVNASVEKISIPTKKGLESKRIQAFEVIDIDATALLANRLPEGRLRQSEGINPWQRQNATRLRPS